MTSLTAIALNNRMLVLLLVIVVTLAGPYSFLSHPSREDPEITIRTAVVEASFPGMAPGRVEDLITRKLEEKIREMPEVEDIISTTRAGKSTIKVELYDRYFDLEPIWQDLRNKMEDVKSDLPKGTTGPTVDDDYGAVAMATIAMTAEGFSLAEMRESARAVRNRLYAVPGISKIDLFGVEPERIFVEFNNARLAQLGLSPQSLIDALQRQNIVSSGGRIEAGSSSFTVEPSGNFEAVEDIRQVPIALPEGRGQVAYLRDLATITRAYVDPPKSPAFFNGRPAIVLSVQMVDQYDSFRFAKDLTAKVAVLEQTLPIGYKLEYVTFQPHDIEVAVSGVMNNLYQTIAIVLVVVMVFLGWRTGLIVGLMVPLTMLATILIMRRIGIELERMSLATMIIALGLLVDNGIVLAEEIGRRLAAGEERRHAALEAGRTLALPLLSSSLTTIIAFMPLMLAENEAGEYTRSLSLVIAIALLSSWAIAMTVTPLLCFWFLKAPEPVDEERVYTSGFYRRYRGVLGTVLKVRLPFLATIIAALLVALWALQFVPKIFFPASDRTQLQVYVDLPVGSNTYGTIKATKTLISWLDDAKANPEITSSMTYVGNGGPRFYLGLNPIDPDPHRAFVIVNTRTNDEIGPVMQRIRAYARANIPEARVQTKPMSMGASEAGLVEYRIYGDDADVLSAKAEQLKIALREIPGAIDIKDNWENRLIKIIVDIDQSRARRSGITSQAVADALNAMLSGYAVTDYREGDTIIPVYIRAEGAARTNIDRLRTLNIAANDGTPVPLMQVADFDGSAEFSMVQRRNLERVITVSAKHQTRSAADFDAQITDLLGNLNLPAGYRIEKGGELEASGEAQGALFANMPLAFALIVLILVGQFNSFRKPLIILAVIPLTLTGVTMGLLAMPGATFSFMAILGLLSLAGIIINNAIVLIDRMDTELASGKGLDEAVLSASAKRLRPILITTVTTVFGLMPIIVARDILFYDLAVVVAGGLAAGTILTLGVVPVLYSLLMKPQSARPVLQRLIAGIAKR